MTSNRGRSRASKTRNGYNGRTRGESESVARPERTSKQTSRPERPGKRPIRETVKGRRSDTRAPRLSASGVSDKIFADDEFVIEGSSAINEYLRFRPERLRQLIRETGARDGVLVDRLPPHCVISEPMDWKSKHPSFRAPTGTWATVGLQTLSESDLFARVSRREHDIIVALDHVTDPRNLGAIARTCGFFGVREVIAPQDRQVLLTPASVATSQGAFSLVDLIEVVNLSRTIEKLKDLGYWVIGADMEGEAVEAVAGFYEKTVLLFGSEGAGVSHLLRKRCDRMVQIAGAEKRLESLNVSVAAGIIINEFCSVKSGKVQSNNA